MPPRAQLISRAPFFSIWTSFGPIRFRVSSFSGVWTVRKSTSGSISWAEAQHLHAQLLGPGRRQERIVAQDLHLQGDGPGGHGLADPPQADDPQRLAGQLRAHELLAVPAALDQALVGGGVLRTRPNIRASVCSAVEIVLPPGVFITTMPCRVAAWHVDVVHADARPGDGPQAVVAGQGLGRDLHPAAADRPVGLQQGLVQTPPPSGRCGSPLRYCPADRSRFRPSSERSSRTMIFGIAWLALFGG